MREATVRGIACTAEWSGKRRTPTTTIRSATLTPCQLHKLRFRLIVHIKAKIRFANKNTKKNETSNVIPKPRTKNPRPVQAGIRIRTSRSKALFITNNQHLRRLPEASRIKYAQLLDHFVGIRNQFVRSFGMTRYDRHTTMPYGNLGQQA